MMDHRKLKMKFRTRMRMKRHILLLALISFVAYWVSVRQVGSISEEFVHREMKHMHTLSITENATAIAGSIDFNLHATSKTNVTAKTESDIVSPPVMSVETKPNTAPNTAIVVLSSWNPSNPSTENLENVIQSIFEHVIGLSRQSPLFVVIDSNHVDDFKTSNANFGNDKTTIHIAGSNDFLETIRLHYPLVQYLYQTHENFVVSAPLDHLALLRTMENPPNEQISEMKYILFRAEYSAEHAEVSKQCIKHRENRWVPMRKSVQSEIIETQLQTSGLGVASGDKARVFMCASSCLYSFPTTHLVNFDWYYELFQTAKQTNPDSTTTSTMEESMTLEVRKLCRHHQQNGETSGMYLFFDDRLYFGNNGLRYIRTGTME